MGSLMLFFSYDTVIHVLFCSRELFELMSTPKGQQRADAAEPSELIQLLIEKDKTIKECIVTGNQQRVW